MLKLRVTESDRSPLGEHLVNAARWRWAPGTIVFVVVLGVSLTYWPGHMSADSLVQVSQVRAGRFNDMHSPLLLSLWHVIWTIVPGTWYVLAGCAAVFVAALSALLRAAFAPVAATLMGAALTISPMLLGFLGVIGRDTWFMALTTAAFGALMVAVGQNGRRQVVTLGIGATFAFLAMAARQNGIPVLFVFVFTVLVAVPIGRTRFGTPAAWRRALLASTGLTILVWTVHLGGVKLIIKPQPTHPEQSVMLYDTVQISVRERTMLVPAELYPAQDLELLIRHASVTNLEANLRPPVDLPFPMSVDQARILKDRWWKGVRDHPRTYLQARAALWCEQVGWCAPVRWVQHPGIDPNPWGYRPTFPGLEHLANRYVASFAANPNLDGGPLFKVWVYLLVNVGGLIYLGHRDARRRVLGGLALAAILYEATILLAAPESQYRFSLLVVAAGLIVGLTAIRDVARALSQRRDRCVIEDVREPAPLDRTISRTPTNVMSESRSPLGQGP